MCVGILMYFHGEWLSLIFLRFKCVPFYFMNLNSFGYYGRNIIQTLNKYYSLNEWL